MNPPVPAGSLVAPITDILHPLDPGSMFPARQPLEIELGSGDGSFLAAYAQGHPERNFIGVERLLGRLRKLDKKGRRLGLTNLRVLRVEAAYLVRHLLPRECAVAMHIYFPDPWPKQRHQKNRLIQPGFAADAARALAAGGVVHLRTDDENYFAQVLAVFAASPAFAAAETPAELAGVRTDFEQEFNARGIPTRLAAFRRV